MRHRERRSFAAFGIILFALAAGAEAQQATGSFSRTLSIDQPVELDVTTGSGSIEIRGSNSDEVSVEGRITVHANRGRSEQEAADLVRRLESDPPIEVTGKMLRVGRFDDRDDLRNVSISYRIEVPMQTSVRSHTGSGSQRIAAIEGPIEARAGSGHIELTDIAGSAEAHAGSGSIEAVGIMGAFTARTGSGTIEVDGRPTADWQLQTGSGGIRARLADDVGVDVQAASGSGGIDVDLPVSGSIRRDRVEGSVRGGGPLLTMRTGSGGIRVE
jgi:DUF4097 and DUF4098 domain-containing protein YvlB